MSLGCTHDVNGYGTNTDYYLEGTQPTMPCNMHRQVRVCLTSRKIANARCRNTRTVAMIYIPEGHPLRNAEDIDQVTEYFIGASAAEEGSSLGVCTIH